MSRRRHLATLLVVFVVLAGCTGGAGPAETTADTTTRTALETTDGNAKTAATSAAKLAADHATALAAAENFTLRWSASLSSESAAETESLSVNTTAFVDAAGGELLLRENASGMSVQTTYVSASGETYRRTTLSGGDVVRYRRPARNYTVEEYRNDSLESLVGAFEFEAAGTTTLDGERVRVYSVTSLDQVRTPDANVTRFDPENVTAVEGRLYVADSGLAKKFTYRTAADVDGVTRTFTYRLEYDAVGSTTVEEPRWLEKARETVEARTTAPTPAGR